MHPVGSLAVLSFIGASASRTLDGVISRENSGAESTASPVSSPVAIARLVCLGLRLGSAVGTELGRDRTGIFGCCVVLGAVLSFKPIATSTSDAFIVAPAESFTRLRAGGV